MLILRLLLKEIPFDIVGLRHVKNHKTETYTLPHQNHIDCGYGYKVVC